MGESAISLTVVLISALTAGLAAVAPAGEAIHAASFAQQSPQGWGMGKGWTFGPAGAKADANCTAIWQGTIPGSCWIEAVFDLPTGDALAKGAALSIAVSQPDNDAGKVIASGNYSKPECKFTLAGVGADAKPLSVDTSRTLVSESSQNAETNAESSGKTLSLGLAISPDRSRLLVNGCETLELPAALPSQGRLSLSANGITLRTLSVSECLPARYAYLTGGVAAFIGGESARPAPGMAKAEAGVTRIDVNGIPMLVERTAAGLASLDISAERWKFVDWAEGTGFLRVPIPSRPYSVAYLLLHRGDDAGKVAAMGFGLRWPEMCAGDLKNIYVDGLPDWRPNEGVTVQPATALGEGWYVARVPLNPAALYSRSISACFSRPLSTRAGLPRPTGKPSSLSVAAVTF